MRFWKEYCYLDVPYYTICVGHNQQVTVFRSQIVSTNNRIMNFVVNVIGGEGQDQLKTNLSLRNDCIKIHQ